MRPKSAPPIQSARQEMERLRLPAIDRPSEVASRARQGEQLLAAKPEQPRDVARGQLTEERILSIDRAGAGPCRADVAVHQHSRPYRRSGTLGRTHTVAMINSLHADTRGELIDVTAMRLLT